MAIEHHSTCSTFKNWLTKPRVCPTGRQEKNRLREKENKRGEEGRSKEKGFMIPFDSGRRRMEESYSNLEGSIRPYKWGLVLGRGGKCRG